MKTVQISQHEFKGYMLSICRDISQSKWTPDYVVGIDPAGFLPALLISEYFDIPFESVRADFESKCWMSDDAFGTNTLKKNILVVAGMNTGDSFEWLKVDWIESAAPGINWLPVWGNNVRFCAVIDNVDTRNGTEADYSGLTVNQFELPLRYETPTEKWWTK